MPNLKYKRVLLKLSGEALAGENKTGLSPEVLSDITSQVKDLKDLGVEVAIVVGGGNFWRGRCHKDMDSCTADHIGMLGTTMNALTLQEGFKQRGVESRVQTSIEMKQIAEFYIKNRTIRHLEKGRVVIFAAGTGNPYFSTDTTAALRAAEIEADVILLAKKVDGVYDKDPYKYSDAKKYDTLTYIEVLEKGLQVMDSTATSLCMDNNIPILVFGLEEPGNIKKAISGEKIGTLVSSKK